MNLKQLAKSTKRVKPGDIFVFQMNKEDAPFYFGRVMKTTVPILGTKGILVYIYDVASMSKDSIPHLRKTDLLVPPIITVKAMWQWGYFETIINNPLEPDDFLEHHCFRWAMRDDMLVDAEGRSIFEKHEPCGDFSLVLPMGMDDRMSDGLGIPRVQHGELDSKTGMPIARKRK